MKVWIDENYCTGDGLCEELCSAMFELGDDGVAHVKGGSVLLADDGPGTLVPEYLEAEVLEAQAESAGECIFVEQ